MESGIKHTDLRNIRQDGGNRIYTLQVGGIVKRSQIITSGKRVQHFLSQQYGFAEFLTSVYHTVAYRIDFVQRLDGAVFGADQCIQDELYTYGVFRYVFFQNLFSPSGKVNFRKEPFSPIFQYHLER